MHRSHSSPVPVSFQFASSTDPLPVLDEEFDFVTLEMLDTHEPTATPEISWEDLEDSGIDLAA